MNSTDKSLVIFKAIVNFVTDVSEIFAEEQHSLKLYNHLITKTTLSHEKAINKHIEAFKEFCVENRESILEKDINKINNECIVYSEKCFINMKDIFSKSDSETEEPIWKHLLFLSALVDPEAKAKEVLKKDASNEGNFLNNILSKVEKEVEGKTNPMEAISSVLQSGVFNEVISDMNEGFKSGELDLSKMMGTMQNIMGQLPKPEGNASGPGGMNDMNSMLSNLMGSMTNNISAGSEGMSNPPDLSGILSTLTSSLPSGSPGEGMSNPPDLSGILSTLTSSLPSNSSNNLESGEITDGPIGEI